MLRVVSTRGALYLNMFNDEMLSKNVLLTQECLTYLVSQTKCGEMSIFQMKILKIVNVHGL